MADVEANFDVEPKPLKPVMSRRRLQPFRLSSLLQLVVQPQLEASAGKDFCMGVVKKVALSRQFLVWPVVRKQIRVAFQHK